MFPPDKLSAGLLGDETCQTVVRDSRLLQLRFALLVIHHTNRKNNKALLGRGIAACRGFSHRAINKPFQKHRDDELSRADASRRVT